MYVPSNKNPTDMPYLAPTEVFGLVAELNATLLLLKPNQPDNGRHIGQEMLRGGIDAPAVKDYPDKNDDLTTKNLNFSNAHKNTGNRPCVFIVDDDEAVREGLELVIEILGLDCQTFTSAEQFLQGYCSGKPGCLLLDYKLPGMNGLELQAEISRRRIRLPIIFLTAHGNSTMAAKALEAGAFGFLTKPAQIAELVERIRAALKHGSKSTDQNGASNA